MRTRGKFRAFRLSRRQPPHRPHGHTRLSLLDLEDVPVAVVDTEHASRQRSSADIREHPEEEPLEVVGVRAEALEDERVVPRPSFLAIYPGVDLPKLPQG